MKGKILVVFYFLPGFYGESYNSPDLNLCKEVVIALDIKNEPAGR